MNRCPTKSVKNKIPQEAWIGMNHSVSHLIFFGSVAYAHFPDELGKKLDNEDINVFLLVTLKTQKHTTCMTLSQGN